GQWAAAVAGWASHNAVHRSAAGPDRNAEYLLYQTLVGAWPIEADRMVAYMEKATKEAKVHTTWSTPNEEYDAAVRDFVTSILSDDWFLDDMARFVAAEKVVEAGRVNSLAQAALLLTCPGSADLYQGTELWDHSLVDPDNRRPVDYEVRRRLLASLSGAGGGGGSGGVAAGGSVVAGGAGFGAAGGGGGAPAVGDDGAAKMWLIHRLLQDRRDRPEAYGPASGYEELAVEGPDRDHVVAFWRSGGVVTVVPRLAARFLSGSGGMGLAGVDAAVRLPGGEWAPVLAGGGSLSGTVRVDDLWAAFPVAVLRGAGQ
ncbi:MAG TPA: hypothetical protein VHT75_11295, partial [Acidimicrobiales bacterium]|nr:hypothetical protein [Acidimicrobiales bacterium]